MNVALKPSFLGDVALLTSSVKCSPNGLMALPKSKSLVALDPAHRTLACGGWTISNVWNDFSTGSPALAVPLASYTGSSPENGAEVDLQVLAYNMKRMINMFGVNRYLEQSLPDGSGG